MNKTFLIGIPIRDFVNPMSRLSNLLTPSERIDLAKNLILNLVNAFSDEETSIYIISNSPEVELFCKLNNLNNFQSQKQGLNEEVKEFINAVDNHNYWTIVHGDLPYITKHFAGVWKKLCESKEIVITESKDRGTPIFGGNLKFNNFTYGKNSFLKHMEILHDLSIKYEKVFHKEFYFELDDEDDYEEFLQNLPRWYKKLNKS